MSERGKRKPCPARDDCPFLNRMNQMGEDIATLKTDIAVMKNEMSWLMRLANRSWKLEAAMLGALLAILLALLTCSSRLSALSRMFLPAPSWPLGKLRTPDLPSSPLC